MAREKLPCQETRDITEKPEQLQLFVENEVFRGIQVASQESGTYPRFQHHPALPSDLKQIQTTHSPDMPEILAYV